MGLSAPRTVKADSTAIEVLRVWLGAEDVHCAVDLGLGMERPEASEWGVLLARVIRRVGRSIEEHGDMEADAAATEIVDALLGEISSSGSDSEDAI